MINSLTQSVDYDANPSDEAMQRLLFGEVLHLCRWGLSTKSSSRNSLPQRFRRLHPDRLRAVGRAARSARACHGARSDAFRRSASCCLVQAAQQANRVLMSPIMFAVAGVGYNVRVCLACLLVSH